MTASARNVAIGFVAGALAVFFFHQLMLLVLMYFDLVQSEPWRLTPVPPFGVPTIINQMFWGGFWGVLFALLADRVPTRAYWSRGLIFGIIFPAVLGSWLIVALIKGTPVFSGFFQDFDMTRLRAGFLLNGLAFGSGLGLLYGLLAHRRA